MIHVLICNNYKEATKEIRNIILDVYRQIDFKDFHIHEFNSSSNILSYVKYNLKARQF